MSLEQIAKATAPQARLHLDTHTHIHMIDDDGKLVISEATGKPITIAQDTISGAWYARVADSFPFFGSKAQKDGLSDLVEAGGVHVPHEDERFRGVWVPMTYYTQVEGSPEKPAKTPE